MLERLTWALALLDTFGPPVEQCGGADEVGTRLEGDATCGLGVLQFVDGSEVAVDQHRVGQWPQMLGGLEFRRVGRQEQQMDVLGYTQPQAFMPAGPVEDEDDLFAGTRATLTGEGREFHLEEGNAHRRGQMKDSTSRGGVDKADEIASLEAVLHRCGRPLPVKTPDFVQDRLEPDAVLVDSPQLNARVWKGRGRLPQQGA